MNFPYHPFPFCTFFFKRNRFSKANIKKNYHYLIRNNLIQRAMKKKKIKSSDKWKWLLEKWMHFMQISCHKYKNRKCKIKTKWFFFITRFSLSFKLIFLYCYKENYNVFLDFHFPSSWHLKLSFSKTFTNFNTRMSLNSLK